LTESHAEVIGPCLLFVAALHEQPYAPLREALNQAGVRMGQLSPTDVRLALNNLAAYLAHYNFPYSILNDLDPDSEQVRAALEAAGLTLKPDTWDMPEAETWDPVNEVSQMGLSPHVEAPHDEKTLPDDGMGM
ncbi:MAG: hypothetical protein JXQ72_06450, partial [Anaerolineae bacterium]|nr:hypothetical protein [Anaerolineae bacterium]